MDMLYIAYEEEKDTELVARVISMGSMLLSPSSIVKFQIKNSEVAIAAYVGLKVKYKIPRTTKYKTGNYFQLFYSGALEEEAQMIDGKPVVFTSLDIHEKK